MKKTIALLLTFTLTLGSIPAWAEDDSDDIVKNTQNDILLVAGAGAAGAILGLSTLSFVDKPSKHISNIWTGAAIGVIAGVIFVAYNSAQKGSEDLQSSREFNSSERLAWHEENMEIHSSRPVQFGSEFFRLSF
jgi:hypothetical protein